MLSDRSHDQTLHFRVDAALAQTSFVEVFRDAIVRKVEGSNVAEEIGTLYRVLNKGIG